MSVFFIKGLLDSDVKEAKKHLDMSDDFPFDGHGSADEDLKDVFGLAIIIVTSSKDKVQTLAFLEHLGFPFKKADAK